MIKSAPVLRMTLLFLAASVSAYAGWSDNAAREVAAPKKAMQNPLKRVNPAGTSAPAITISAPPAEHAVTTLTSATFILTSSKPATICWMLDSGAKTCSPQGVMSFNATLINLTTGNHTLSVTATDAASNIAANTRCWTVR